MSAVVPALSLVVFAEPGAGPDAVEAADACCYGAFVALDTWFRRCVERQQQPQEVLASRLVTDIRCAACRKVQWGHRCGGEGVKRQWACEGRHLGGVSRTDSAGALPGASLAVARVCDTTYKLVL